MTDKRTIWEPSDLQLMQLYRDWWFQSYNNQPNSQATIIAAAFARHVLATFGKQESNEQ